MCLQLEGRINNLIMGVKGEKIRVTPVSLFNFVEQHNSRWANDRRISIDILMNTAKAGTH